MDTKEDKASSDTSENAPERAKTPSGPVAAFQEKMETWTDMVGYGAKRGFFGGLFIAWAIALLSGIMLLVNYLNPQNGLEYDTSTITFWGFVEIGFRLIIGWPLMLVPPGVIIGAILGAVGIIRKKNPANELLPSEPFSSEPEKAKTN